MKKAKEDSPLTSVEQLTDKLRQVQPLLKAEGVTGLTLFGSQARGTADADSDIDITIDVAPQSSFSVLNLVGVEEIVTEATGIKANAFMRRSVDTQFRQEIQRDGIAVF